jgi:serine/threonine-protein kinase
VSTIASTIDGRYQVITRIASGGMGEVYRAHDAVLGREVALKVLHTHLAGDRGFVERFRREARAAAILNHPNIVGVYDWGSTEGTYFMIMEFVRGMNVRSLLTAYERLEPAQVAEIVLPVLSALDHAHGHGIVHRDIKPENILISEDGMVKVADFGLARAYAESSVSQAEGTVTGTVQYLAPEQIRGEPADPRSDLYALGVVMFELLTGRTPFSGETSLAIAYQHLSANVPAPSTVAPGVYPGLDEAVLHATVRERDERPASARAFRSEIVRAAALLPPAGAIRELAGQIPTSEYVPEERATTVTIPRAQSPRARRARKLRWAFGILAVLLALAGGGVAGWTYLVPHYAHVPRVAGRQFNDASDLLQRAGFVVRQGPEENSHTVPAGTVIRSIPPPGTRLQKGKVVQLIVSKGPELLLVPDVHSIAETVARDRLETAGFTVTVKRASSETIGKGKVIDQSPENGEKLEKGSAVTITVSTGPPLVKIPDVSNQPFDAAKATLEGLGFKVTRTDDYSTSVDKGNVIGTSPRIGSSPPKGSTITVTVSKGPKTFPMPDVVNKTKDEALNTLQALGLTVDIVLVPAGTAPPDQVVFQDPAAGTTVKQGDTVTIFVTS